MRALIALLLTILFAQAVPAHEITLDRTRGSVFSAATVEVRPRAAAALSGVAPQLVLASMSPPLSSS